MHKNMQGAGVIIFIIILIQKLECRCFCYHIIWIIIERNGESCFGKNSCFN